VIVEEAIVEPYVIRQNDYLLKMAHKFDFDADTVWNDPRNAALRQLRANPNILWPTDILYIPDQLDKQPMTHVLTPGTTNVFVSDPPTATVSVRFVGDDESTYASKAYTVQELDHLTGLATDEEGVATFPVPVTLGAATVVFAESSESYTLSLGALDPINTLSGLFQRLRNLGYVGGDAEFDATDLDTLRVGLLFLKALVPGTCPDSSAAASTPPPSVPAGGSVSSPYVDNAGLSDDGTLSDDAQQMLLEAHGC
jgi:hypothetical protein